MNCHCCEKKSFIDVNGVHTTLSLNGSGATVPDPLSQLCNLIRYNIFVTQ